MANIDSKFKNDMGIYYTQPLFFETATSDKSKVVYTLKDEEYKGYPSIKELYLEMEDLTEYEFANTYFGGWNHWKKLLKASWFREHLETWREELDLKIMARSLNAIRAKAKSTEKDAFVANRYLLEKGYEKKSPSNKASKAGRPSQQKINEAAQRLKEEEDSIKEDAKRILN